MTPSEAQPVFARLREILKGKTAGLIVRDDSASRYAVGAASGPAAIKAWGGKVKSPTIEVTSVKMGKAYVSYHLMGFYGNPELSKTLSKPLKARMQGKTCFNFTKIDEPLFAELEQVTVRAIAAFKKAGFTQ
jgi:hypothetical protein